MEKEKKTKVEKSTLEERIGFNAKPTITPPKEGPKEEPREESRK